MSLFLCLAGNAAILALAWGLYVLVGFLLFHRTLRCQGWFVRLNLYPLLGWAFLVSFAYGLRMIAIPFAVSGPLALGCLVVGLCFRLPKLRPLNLRRGRLMALAGMVILINLAVLLPRMAVPGLRDVGTWGYDQNHYVYTASGLLDTGLLPASAGGGFFGLFLPYGEYVADSLRQIPTLFERKLDWSFSDLQTRLEVPSSMAQNYALFPRRAFSSLDALVASVLRLDPQQAYTLSVWMQHLLLVHLALILTRRLRWGPAGLILVLALVAYWPNSVLPNLVDNRDQANSLVLVFLLGLLAVFRSPPFWAVVTVISALFVGYPEVAIPAMVSFYGLRFSQSASVCDWWKTMSRQIGTALLCLLPLLPPALFGLIRQWQPPRPPMAFPPQYSAPWAWLDLFPGWSILLKEPASHPYPVVLVDLVMLAVAIIGGVVLWRRGWKFGLLSNLAVGLVAWVLLMRGNSYTAYKVMTVFWPFFLLLVLTGFNQISEKPPRHVGIKNRAWRILAAVSLWLLLVGASIPAWIWKAQLHVPGLWIVQGLNSRLKPSVSGSQFWQPRQNDLTRGEALATEAAAEAVLVITPFEKQKPKDIGYVQMLLRRGAVFYPSSLQQARYTRPHPNQKPASAETPVDRILFVNGRPTSNFHAREAHQISPPGMANGWRRNSFFSELALADKTAGVILTPAAEGDRLEKQAASNAASGAFLFDGDAITCDVHLINQQPGEMRVIALQVFAASALPPGAIAEVRLNSRIVTGDLAPSQPHGWEMAVPLEAEPMHQRLEIRIVSPAEFNPEYRLRMADSQSPGPFSPVESSPKPEAEASP